MFKAIFNEQHIIKLIILVYIGIGCMVQAYAHLASNKTQINSTIPVVTHKTAHQGEVIVLVHGLFRSSLSMSLLKFYLENEGYQVYSYNYPSTKYTIYEHGINLNQYIVDLMIKNPGAKIHFITHSLGGIITREALAKLPQDQLNNLGYLVMMAPPNQGSYFAKLLTRAFPQFTRPIKPLAELSTDKESYVHRVPVPQIKMGIIAGRFDSIVPPAFAKLNGATDFVRINAIHTFIMDNFKGRKLILNFLENGTFASKKST